MNKPLSGDRGRLGVSKEPATERNAMLATININGVDGAMPFQRR
jgi:hypothetical protein